MGRFGFVLLCFIPGTGLLFAQTTSTVTNPRWDNNADWTGTAPGYDTNQSAILDHDSDISGNSLIINGGHTVTINAGRTLTTDETITIKVGGTLIVNGTITGTDAGKEFKIENGTLTVNSGGIFDWAGFWTSDDDPATITIDGSVTVGGDMSNKTTIGGSGSLVVNGTLNNDGGSIFGCTDAGDGCCSGPGCTLPVELLNFKAAPIHDNSGVLIEWSTATEVNNDYFTLKRSDDHTRFETIAVVKGAGNSQKTENYAFIDRYPHYGRNYYSLTQTDYDGTSETFYTISVYIEARDKVQVYPVPVTAGHSLTVKMEIPKEEHIHLRLRNILGKEVFNDEFSAEQGIVVNRSIRTTGMTAGSYILTIAGPGLNENYRVIIR